MKLYTIAILSGLAALSGCAVSPSSPPPTVGQVVAQLCPIAQEVGTILQAPGVLSAKDSAFIDDAKPAVAKMCAVGATVTALDLHSFANATLPAILDMVNSSTTMDATKKARISAGLLLAQVSIGLVR